MPLKFFTLFSHRENHFTRLKLGCKKINIKIDLIKEKNDEKNKNMLQYTYIYDRLTTIYRLLEWPITKAFIMQIQYTKILNIFLMVVKWLHIKHC